MFTKEVRKPRLRGRKKSLVEDPNLSLQLTESDLSSLFGVGLTPEDGSTRSSCQQSQGETPARQTSPSCCRDRF